MYIPSLSFIYANRDFIVGNWAKNTVFVDTIIFYVFGVLKEP